MTERDEPYTPSLAKVRNTYASLFVRGDQETSKAEFDRMIEAVRAEEREKAAQIAKGLARVADKRAVRDAAAIIAARIGEQGNAEG